MKTLNVPQERLVQWLAQWRGEQGAPAAFRYPKCWSCGVAMAGMMWHVFFEAGEREAHICVDCAEPFEIETPEDRGIAEYSTMQKNYYSSIPATDQMMKDHVVGCYDEHEKYPYEKYLFSKYEGGRPSWGMTALDFGCGPGRMIRRMAKFFRRVDGVDISPTCIEAAHRWLLEPSPMSRLFVNNGIVLDGVPSEEYDLVYSTIAFHHINSYPIRMSLLREFFRVLKPGGRIAIQMFYTTTPRVQWAQHCDWRESNHDAPSTNGYHDVRITPRNTVEVQDDLYKIGFEDPDFQIAPYPPPPHPKGPSETDWVFIHARKP